MLAYKMMGREYIATEKCSIECKRFLYRATSFPGSFHRDKALGTRLYIEVTKIITPIFGSACIIGTLL